MEAGYSSQTVSDSPQRPKLQNKTPTNVLLTNDTSENSFRSIISIEEFNVYEEKQAINSPKSLYALTTNSNRPIQRYADRNKQLPKEVIKLRFEFFENKRLEMINSVKKARQKIIEELKQNGSNQSHIEQAVAPLQPKIFGNAGFNMKLGIAPNRSQADLSQMSGGSRMGSSAQIDHAVQRDRELFQKQMEICERTRQKEAKMFRDQIKSRQIQIRLKGDQEKKYRDEIERAKILTEIEKKEKQYQWKSFIKRLQKRKEEEKLAEYKKQLRKELMQERDKLRQEKFIICQERNEQIMEMNRSRIIFVHEKHEKMLQNLEEKKRVFQLTAREKKQEKEQFKQKVFENLQKQEQEKEKGWFLKQIEEKEKEMRIKRDKERLIKEQILRAQQQDRKIKEALVLSERKDNERKENLLYKQSEASMRLERQRSRQRFQEQLKKEMFNLKNMSKDFNRQRASRRHEFKKEQLVSKLDQDQSRYSALVDERNYLKEVRIKTLIESEIQRENIKNALYQMSVWNTFDPKIIFHIMGKERYYEGQGIGGGDLTIEELVRKTAVSQQRQRKVNRHLFSSSLGFQSMGGATQPSTSVPLTERGNYFKVSSSTNLFGFVSPPKTNLGHYENQSAEDISLAGGNEDTPQLYQKGALEREQHSLRNQSSEQIDHLQGSTFMRHSHANSVAENERQQNSYQNNLDDSHSGLTYDVKIPKNKKKPKQIVQQQTFAQRNDQQEIEQDQDIVQKDEQEKQQQMQEKYDQIEYLNHHFPTEEQTTKD
ncbi:UNKNOWN [Stylonychia lemnae]|uniref:Uncharacterized protein n=1 Tax=Stylonychia lemnae TaxID=5949 RepID=A0A078ARZ6_STYLE|nr:UNKNOWN [Stylonychia lemnae]|eukprot:CDW84944.1 UNKNOWN [Stylonychia lemnae]